MSARIDTLVLPASQEAIRAAVRALESGGLVAFPTETVYGLGADATNATGVAKIYAAKERPSFNPLISHVGDLTAAERIARFDDASRQLAQAFWPGPLTLVLSKALPCPVAELATAGLDTIAVRVPAHPVARDLLAAFGKPLVGPSANRSGHVSPTTAAHVVADLGGRVDLVLDGGATPVGVESTVVACLGDDVAMLRPGGVPREEIERVLQRLLSHHERANDADAPLGPGMLASHYAPRTKLRLNAESVRDGEALLAFGPRLPAGADKAVMVLNLSPRGDLVEAAANLFSHLRTLDAAGAPGIAAMAVPVEGLGEAINDRLTRAAAPRH